MRQKTENFFIQNFQSRAGCLSFTVFFLLGCAAGAYLGIRGTADAPEWTVGYVNRLLEQGRPHFAFLLLRTVRFWLLFYAFGFTRLGLLLVPLLIFLRGLLLGDCFAIWFTCCSGSGCIWAACCYAALTLPLTMLLSIYALKRSAGLFRREPDSEQRRGDLTVALLAIPAALALSWLSAQLPASLF